MPTPEEIRGLVERFNQKVFNDHDLDPATGPGGS
jgi:hypothetical protein